MGQANLSGKEVFPGWCPHCWGSSHSFQPDVLGQGARHSLRPCKGSFTLKGSCTGDGGCWQGWCGAGGHKGQVGTSQWSQQGQAGTSPLGGSGLVSLSTCHIQLWDAQVWDAQGWDAQVWDAQLWVPLRCRSNSPPDAQLCPTWLSISPRLTPHRHQIPENTFSG